MSAYIVSREHILYLVQSAITRAMRENSNAFRWYHERNWREIAHGDFDQAAEVANMLWLENIRSVSHRYPNESSATLPGPVGEDFVIKPGDFQLFTPAPEPVQLLKSIHCYEYQSCEHGEWKASSAHAFCEALERSAMRALPGYEDAAWGPPEKPSKTRSKR